MTARASCTARAWRSAWRWRTAFRPRMNLCSPDDALRVEAHLADASVCPGGVADIPGDRCRMPTRLLAYIAQDKKVSRGALTFILTHGVGKAFIAKDVPASGEVLAFLKEKLRDERAGLDRPGVLARHNPFDCARSSSCPGCLPAFGFAVARRRRPATRRAGEAAVSTARPMSSGGGPTRTGGRLGHAAPISAELEVSDVMVHRTNMRSFNADSPPEALVREILLSPHTRMPLWKGSTENIVGVRPRQGSAARARNEAGNDFFQDRRDEDRDQTLVRARHRPDAAGPAQRASSGARRISPSGRRRIWRGRGAGHAGGHHRGDRRRHRRRARHRRSGRQAGSRRLGGGRRHGSDPRSEPGARLDAARRRRRPPSPAWSSTRRSRSPRNARPSPSTASVSSS